MNKGEFIDELAERTGFTKKDSKKSLNSTLDIITETLKKNEKIVFAGFGKFEPRARKATTRINPQTGEEIQVPAKVVPKFKEGKNLKEDVKENLEAVNDGSGELEVEKA